MGKYGVLCREISPTLYYLYNKQLFIIQESANITFENIICSSQLVPNYYLFGGMKNQTTSKCNTDEGIISSQAILVTFSSISDDEKRENVKAWQNAARKYVDDNKSSLTNMNVNYYWGNGINDEVVRGITDAIPKIAISVAIVIVFLMITLVDCKNSTRSFTFLAVMAVLVTVLGVLLGFGFSLTVGVMWTPTTIVIAFLVLGMGVNNAVLLHNTFERQDKSLPIEEQNAEAVGEASIFITLTSATTLLSFFSIYILIYSGYEYWFSWN